MIQTIDKLFTISVRCLLIAAFLVLCNSCTEKETYPNTPVSVEYLRGEYVKSLIESMDEYQCLGDAENSMNGWAELFDRLEKLANKVYPDGEYLSHCGRGEKFRDIEGYKPHSCITYHSFYRQVYIKVDSKEPPAEKVDE